ncbi:ribose 5-phosphate isomerase B [Spiroplasma culicicola]|uniref:Ribose-5-phosphate isomerase B n=1 Tax=Spiroplasma culicicola AES-1 TaxID=1276246 RepID=W6A5I8_9MOLU|nr:ribose 5-phosphate isomerase B [Spiroplasma culicicola]AHI52393.1 ribose-5-phosphate isomerase B [Spiroplasma culicicola AES-1]
MKIYIGNDHTGVEMKDFIKNHLVNNGYEVIDLGTNTQQSVDYPNFGKDVAQKTVADPGSFGIVICGTGIGISIAANKVKGARAALCYEQETAKLSREHNNANILALGARVIANHKAIGLVDIFLSTEFEGDRHSKRVDMLND